MPANPMDVMIGGPETTSMDRDRCARHVAAAREAEAAGDRERAIAELRRAVSADPGDAAALFKLAYHADLVGEEDEAVSLYERICTDPPAPINALINLAILFEDRGDYVRAERCLRQVLETQPAHVRARLYMKDVQAARETPSPEEPERDVSKRRQLLETPVTDFDLSVRTRTCLKKMSVRTLGDLLRINESELASYKNLGETGLIEIKRMLAAKGLRLGQGLEDSQRAYRRQMAEQLRGSTQEAALAKPVTDLQLSVRARKALQMLGIQTLGDLASHTEAELMGVKNFGATSLIEIKERLAEHGLGLRAIAH